VAARSFDNEILATGREFVANLFVNPALPFTGLQLGVGIADSPDDELLSVCFAAATTCRRGLGGRRETATSGLSGAPLSDASTSAASSPGANPGTA
jgi:hypothetical protein